MHSHHPLPRRLRLLLVTIALALLAPPAVSAAGPGSISGTVSGPSGPLSAIEVTATAGPESASATTAADGTYTIGDLAAGTYTVTFSDPGDTFAPGFFGSGGFVDDPSKALPVSVAAGPVTGVNATLPVGRRIAGVVRDAAGRPEPDIAVSACRTDACVGPTPSRPDGHYRLIVQPGTYVLRVAGRSGAVIGWWGASGIVAARTDALSIVVTDAPIIQDLRLPPGANAPHIRGLVRSSGGTPAPGIELEACPSAGPCFAGVTAEGGVFNLVVDPGTYLLRFTDPDDVLPSGYWSSEGWVATAEAATPVVVAAADVEGIDLRFPGAGLSGRVTSAPGAGLAGIAVRVCPASGTCLTTTTAADGRYEITVPPASYRISFSDPAAVHAPAFYLAGPGSTDVAASATLVEAALEPIPNLDETLAAGRRIRGIVLGPTGAPAPSMTVSACPSGRLCSVATTGSNGRFAVAVAPGSYRILVAGTVAGQAVAGYLGTAGFTETIARARVLAVRAADVAVEVFVSRAPQPSFVLNSALSSAAPTATLPVRQTWSVGAAPSATYILRRSVDGGAFVRVASLPQAAGPRDTADVALALAHRYRFDVQRVGGPAIPVQVGPAFTLTAYQEGSSAIAYSGTWVANRTTNASGGATRLATAKNARATFTFTGRALAWIAPRGAGQGSAQVFVDNVLAATINLSGSTSHRRVVFAASWPTSARHTLRIVVAGTAGHPAVQVDAFVVAR